jgi:hypothetical protein
MNQKCGNEEQRACCCVVDYVSKRDNVCEMLTFCESFREASSSAVHEFCASTIDLLSGADPKKSSKDISQENLRIKGVGSFFDARRRDSWRSAVPFLIILNPS